MSHIWKVAGLDYVVSQDGLSNVVTTVHWICSKEDENGNSGYAYGAHGLPEPDPANFVAWDSLDESTAVSWAVDAMGEDEVNNIQSGIDAQIAEKVTPTVGTGRPWEA